MKQIVNNIKFGSKSDVEMPCEEVQQIFALVRREEKVEPGKFAVAVEHIRKCEKCADKLAKY